MKPIRVLLADDHILVRAGFRALLQTMAGIEVVAEAGEGHEALRLIGVHRPDVVLTDITMPGLNGLEVAVRVAKEWPRARVRVLSMHASEQYVSQALRAGAAGYLLKDAAPAELEVAIRAVARGESYLSPAVSKPVITGYVHGSAGGPTSFEQLTPRQREVLQLIAEGHSTKEIAKKLAVSVKTVETHRGLLMERLDLHDVAGLVR